MQKIFHGPKTFPYSIEDFSLRESLMMVPLAVIIIWLGVFPQPVLDTTAPIVNKVLENRSEQAQVAPATETTDKTAILKGGLHE